MKICFMGTPNFALLALKNLIKHNYNITCVYTKTPKPKGRGKILTKSEVHDFAITHNIPVLTPKTLRNPEVQQEFINQNFDLCIVASYGLILPKAILVAPKYGCINIHASLLPKLRGASPIQMSIVEAPSLNYKTGITTMRMDEGLDTGDILLQEEVPITNETTFTSLYNQLSEVGAELIIKTIKQLENNTLTPIKQDDTIATHVGIITKQEGKINFQEPADLIERKIKAFNPFPSTYFYYKDEIIKVTSATAIKENHNYKLGEVISVSPLQVACSNSIIQFNMLQRQGKKLLNSEDLLRGFKILIGDIFN